VAKVRAVWLTKKFGVRLVDIVSPNEGGEGALITAFSCVDLPEFHFQMMAKPGIQFFGPVF
jgi:hypothetical protein